MFTRHSFLTRLVAAITANCLLGASIVLGAGQIVVDGRTQTQLQVKGSVTDVTTQTVRGRNAFNSFSRFDVYQGNTVNLHVPDAARNLVNLVHDKGTRIDGTLNAYRQGQIGGNVFFANPHGMVVGASGVVNVGALSVTTPTKQFMDGFFDAAGNPSARATQQLLDGTAPVNPDALVDIQGQVNALGDIRMQAGSILIAGDLNSLPAPAAGHALALPVNTEGLEDGTDLVERNGEIWLLASNDVGITGNITSDGADGQDAGGVYVRAGNDIELSGDARLSARGYGEDSNGGTVIVLAENHTRIADNATLDAGSDLGDGGFVELSAIQAVTLAGGFLRADALNGIAGAVLIDPENLIIATDLLRGQAPGSGDGIVWDAGSLTLEATQKITIEENVVISTRQVIVNAGQSARDAHLNNDSVGSSGDLTLTAKQIEVKQGAQLRADANNGQVAGTVALNAVDDASTPVFGSFEDQVASISVMGAIIKGGDIELTASADDKYEYDGAIADRVFGFLDDLITPVDVSSSQAEASVLLDGGAVIDASGDVTISSDANSDVGMFVIFTGLAFGWAEAFSTAHTQVLDASIDASGDVSVSSRADSRITMTVAASNDGRTNPLPGNANKYIDLAVAVSKGKIDSLAEIGEDATVTANGRSLKVEATGKKHQNTTAFGKAYDDGTAGAAVGVALFDSEVVADFSGTADVGSLEVDAALTTEKNSTNVISGAGTGLVGGITKTLDPRVQGAALVSKFTDFVSKTTISPRSRSSSTKLGLAAGFAWVDHANGVTARVGSTGNVTATGPVVVNAYAQDDLTYHASASVDQAKIQAPTISGTSKQAKQVALSAAVAVANLDNHATASIDDGAGVSALGDIEVNAKSDIPPPWLAWVDLFNVAKESFGGVDDVDSFFTGLYDLLTDGALQDTVLDGTFSLATGWTQAFGEAESFAFSGSFDILDLDNRATASIGDGARINQNPTLAGQGDVTVFAEATQDTINLSGIFGFNPKKAFTGTQSGSNGFGGAYLDMNFTGGADASIGKDVLLDADNVAVVAYTDFNNISLGESGGTAGKVGINGVFSLTQSDTDTIAQIASGGTLNADNVLIAALDDSQNINAAGGIAKGGNVGIGFAISINEVVRDVYALAGNAPVDLRQDSHVQIGSGGSLTTTGNLLLDAQSDGRIGSYSLAGAIKGNSADTPSDAGAKNTKKGKGGIGVSADVSINDIDDTTEALANGGLLLDIGGLGDQAAHIGDASVDGFRSFEWTAGTDPVATFELARGLHLSAINGTDMHAFSGAVTIGQGSLGLAGSFSFNDIAKLTHAWAKGVAIDANDVVDISAVNSGDLLAINASGSGAAQKEGIQIVGQYAQNDIRNQAFAAIEDSRVTVGNDVASVSDRVSLTATDSSVIHAVAGAVTLGGKAGIGASVSDNTIANKTRAYIKDSRVDAGERLEIEARNDNDIRSLAATFGVSTSLSASGSGADNDIVNETKVYIDNTNAADKTIVASDATRLLARDESLIETLSGGLSLSKEASLGVSVSVNRAQNTTAAYIKNAKQNEIANDTDIKAENLSTLRSLSGAIGGAIKTVGAGGAVAVNRIANTTSAYVTGSDTDLVARNLVIGSSAESDIETISVAVGVSKDIGIGGSVTTNYVDDTVEAYINEGARVLAEGNVGVLAESDQRIQVAAGAAGVGIKGGGVGLSISINEISGSTKAYVDGVSTRVTGRAKGSELLTINSGGLQDDVNLADQVDLATYSKLDLKAKKATEDVSGVAVVASATQHIESIGVNVAGGAIAAGVVENINTIGGSTQAYVLNARINSENAGAEIDQGVHVVAGNTAYANSFIGNIAVGGGALGVGADIHTVSRTTRAYTLGGALSARGAIDVNAVALQGVSSLVVGGSVGGTGAAGSLSLVLFDNLTESYVDNTDIEAASLDVTAANDNELYMVGGAIAGGSTGVGGAFVVGKSDSTTRAYIADVSGSDSLSISGDVVVRAENRTDIDQIAVSGAFAGGVGVAGMAAVNLITDTTEASVDNSTLGSASNKAATLTVAAVHDLDINTIAGSLGVAISAGGVGVGAGASVNVVKARTTATIADSTTHTSGATRVAASSDKVVENLTLTAGVGQTAGIGAAAAVTLVGDDVKDEAAEEVDSGTLSAVDEFANNERVLSLDADDPDIITDAERARVNDSSRTDVRSIATGTNPADYQFRTAAAVTGTSDINAGNLDVSATDRTGAVSTVGGFGISLGLGAGAGVGVTKVKSNVYAGIDDMATVTTDGDIDVTAVAGDKNFIARLNDETKDKSIEILALNGNAGLVGLGAAVAIAEIDNNVAAEVGGTVNAGSGKVSVEARDTSEIDINAYGGSIGAVGAGAVIARVDKTSQVNARTYAGTQITAADLLIDASSRGQVRSFTLGAAGGLFLAGVGADAQSTEATLVQANTGDDNTINLTGDLDINANVRPDARAEARGYGGAGAAFVGVAIANALVSNAAVAELGSDGNVTADNVTVGAHQTRIGDTTARAKAIAAGGALIGSASATQAEARNTGVVQATVGADASLTVAQAVTVDVNSDSRQTAEVDGFNGALGAAIGSNVATASYLTGHYAGLGEGVTVNADSLAINIAASDENYADSLSGQGALLASISAAKVLTSGVSNTEVSIGNGRNGSIIDVNRLAIDATHTARFNTKANTYNGALVGKSGANVDNNVTANLAVRLGTLDGSDRLQADALVIDTEDLAIAANNLVRKPNLGTENVLSGSGGFYDGPAIESDTRINLDTSVSLGDGISLTVSGDPEAPGRFDIEALNDIEAYDKVKLDSGGAIANAKGVSRIYVNQADATVDVGDNAELRSVGAMRLGARTLADVETFSYVNTYGLSGSGTGTTRSEINADNAIDIGSNALLRAEGDLILGAGTNGTEANDIDATATTRLYNKTAVPFNTDPEAHGEIDQRNTITIASGAEALSVADVYLLASNGSHNTTGDGTGTDLYREGGEAVVNFFGGLVGADEVSFDIQGGSTSDVSVSGVLVDGEARAGIQHNQFLTIAEDGSVALDSEGNPIQSDGVTFTVNEGVSLNKTLADRIEQLEDLAAEYADVPDIAQAFQVEADFLRLKLDDLGGEEVTVNFINVADIFARSGDVHISGDYLAGGGLLEAPGDTQIRIWNRSDHFMSLNKLTISEDQGGKVLYNGARVHNNADVIEKNIAQYLADISNLFAGGGIPQSNLTVIDAANSALPDISVLSTNVRADPLAGVFLDGDISNRRGTVSIYSEGDVTASGNIDAYSVDIKAGRDVMLGFVWGFRHLGGDPTTHEPFSSLARTSEILSRDRGVTSAREALPSESGILAGGNVFISAERVNINNTIQAGRPYRTVNIDAAMTNLLPGLQAAYDNGTLGSGGRIVGENRYALNFVPGTENDLAADFVRAWYNFDTQRIELEPLRVEGGKVVLYGDIFSTGNGVIKAVDGYGRINVVNNTDYALEIARVDTGGGPNGIEGRIQITDTARRILDTSSGQYKPTTTVYTRLGDEIQREISYLDVNGDQVFVFSGADEDAIDGRNSVYQPKENRHFHWVNGRTTRTDEERIYTTRVLFGLDWLVPDYDDPDRRSSQEFYTPRISGDYLADSRGPELTNDYYHDYSVVNGSWYRWRSDDVDRKGVVCIKSACAYEDITVTAFYRKFTYEYYNHSIAADKPIDIQFTGWDTGDINIASQGRVYLTDKVRNLTGKTEIAAAAGLYQDSSDAIIEAKNLTLRADAGSIMGSGAVPGTSQVDIDLIGSVLNLYAMDDIVVHEENGDLTIGEIVSTAGEVRLSADLGIFVATGDDAPASGVNVTAAKDIVLESAFGAIGNSEDGPIVVDTNAAGGYTISANAAEDIDIREHSGDLLVDSIKSLGGDVSVRVPDGDLLDANGDEQRDLAAEQALLESVANELGLLDPDAIARREQAAIAAYESSIDQAYETYWREERGLTPDGVGGYTADAYDPNVSFSFSTAEAAALSDAGWSAEQIAAHEADRTARYRAFGQSDYDVGFDYSATAAERADLLEGIGWERSEIANRLPRSLFAKEVSDTETRIEGANIAGRNVFIEVGGRVGTSRGDVIIAGGTDVADLTDQQRLALASAERDDIVFESDRVVINQKEDVDVELSPGGTLELHAVGEVYLGSESDLNIKALSGDAIRIKAAGGIYNADVNGTAATIVGTSAILESAKRGVGTTASPLRLDLADTGRLTGRSKEDFVVFEQLGDIWVDFIFSTALVQLSTLGNIYDAAIDLSTDIRAARIDLRAGGNVGDSFIPEAYLDVGHNPDGWIVLDVVGNAALFSPSQSLQVSDSLVGGDFDAIASLQDIDFVGTLAAGGDVTLAAAGSILGSGDGAHVVGQAFDFTAVTGTIGEPGQSLAGDSSGQIELEAPQGIYYREINGALISNRLVSDSGSISVEVTNGNGIFGLISAPETVQLIIGGDTLVVDRLEADVMDLSVAGDLVDLKSLLLGQGGTVSTPLHNIVVDNSNDTVHWTATAQLYSPNEAFALRLFPERRFQTDAFLINYDPNYIANTFSTENSLSRLQLKRDTLVETTADTLTVEGGLVDAIRLADIMADNLAPAAAGLVDYDEEDDEELLGLSEEDEASSAADLEVAN